MIKFPPHRMDNRRESAEEPLSRPPIELPSTTIHHRLLTVETSPDDAIHVTQMLTSHGSQDRGTKPHVRVSCT